MSSDKAHRAVTADRFAALNTEASAAASECGWVDTPPTGGRERWVTLRL